MTTLFAEQALLPDGWRRNVRLTVDGSRIAAVEPEAAAAQRGDEHHAILLPGMANLHSHAFQRGMAGLAERRGPGPDTFWSWREVMYRFALTMTPDQAEAVAAQLYVEMLEAGFTAVGEFHYLGVDEAFAAAEAAEAAGIVLVLLHVAYGRGGLPRMRQESVSDYLTQVERLQGAEIPTGLAPHSVRACPVDWLEEIGRYAVANDLPLHVHADEQPKEIEECLAEHGCRPIELLARAGCLTERTTVVHATHANGAELDLLASHGSTICACPTTEADLGDGFLPAERVRTRGIPICIGSDSNVRIDPFEELRELEGIARRQTGRRGVFSTEELYAVGVDIGARSLGIDGWPEIEIDVGHRSLRDVEPAHVRAALIAGCTADVVVA